MQNPHHPSVTSPVFDHFHSNYFLMFRQEFLYFSFICPLPFILTLDITDKKLASLSLQFVFFFKILDICTVVFQAEQSERNLSFLIQLLFQILHYHESSHTKETFVLLIIWKFKKWKIRKLQLSLPLFVCMKGNITNEIND